MEQRLKKRVSFTGLPPSLFCNIKNPLLAVYTCIWGKDTWLGRGSSAPSSETPRVHLKGNDIHTVLGLDKESDLCICLLNALNLYFSFPILLSIRPKKKKMNATKSEHLNSAHMTFPSHLITSIQFTSASHARPQSIKHAPWQRRSCPIITPIIKVQELWVAQLADGWNKQVFKFIGAGSRPETNQSRPLYHHA